MTNESVFSEVYHALIHSAALETLLNLEHTYALSVEEIITQRDRDLEHLEQRSEEMDFMLTLLMLEMEYSGFGGQYHACWCSGS